MLTHAEDTVNTSHEYAIDSYLDKKGQRLLHADQNTAEIVMHHYNSPFDTAGVYLNRCMYVCIRVFILYIL